MYKTCEDFEILTVLAGNIVYSVCYRPPNGNLSTFYSFYEHFLSFISDNQYSVVSGGDLTIDMLVDSTVNIKMRTLLTSFYFLTNKNY